MQHGPQALAAVASEADNFDMTDAKGQEAVEARIKEFLLAENRAKMQKLQAKVSIALFARRALVARRSASYTTKFNDDYLAKVVGLRTKHGALKWIRSQLLFFVLPPDLQQRISAGNCAELLRYVNDDDFGLETFQEMARALSQSFTKIRTLLDSCAPCGAITREQIRKVKEPSAVASTPTPEIILRKSKQQITTGQLAHTSLALLQPSRAGTGLAQRKSSHSTLGMDEAEDNDEEHEKEDEDEEKQEEEPEDKIRHAIDNAKRHLKDLNVRKKQLRARYREIAPLGRERKSKKRKLLKLLKKANHKAAKIAQLEEKICKCTTPRVAAEVTSEGAEDMLGVLNLAAFQCV